VKLEGLSRTATDVMLTAVILLLGLEAKLYTMLGQCNSADIWL
jgi:hypothetical protein